MLSEKWIEGAGDLTDAYALRRAVFVDEQGTSEEEEMDGQDADAAHLVVYDGGAPVAAGRIIVKDGVCYLGRICVRQDRRRERLGAYLTRRLIQRAFRSGYAEQVLHAQLQAQDFYSGLGFEPFGETDVEANSPHISMRHIGDAGG
jgi:predicted GNAT family N-acyltransferase